MRSHITVLVLAVIFLSCATSSLAIKPEMVVHKTNFFVSGQHSILTKRVLRAQNTANENDEERANIGIDKVMAHLKASTSRFIDSAKLNTWLIREKPVDEVWSKLQLGAGVEKVVQNPNLKLLDEYVNMFNKKYPENQMSLLQMLIFRYNDEALANALVAARHIETSRDIATKLQKQQLEMWRQSRMSVDDVFSLLKLKDEGINLFKSQKLETMDEYIKLFKFNDPQKVLYNALVKAYDGEYNTAILISGAMGNKPTSEGASRFQQIQFQGWISMNYDPTSILSKVFKVHSNDLAASTNNLRAQEKSIVAAYTSAFNKAMGIDKADDVVSPRRS